MDTSTINIKSVHTALKHIATILKKKYKCQLSTVPLLNFRNGSSNILTHFDSLIFQLVNIFGKMYQSLLMSI